MTVKTTASSTVQWAHDYLDLTWDEVGTMLGTTSRTTQRWRDRETAPNRTHSERLEALDELRFWIEEVFEDESAARDWLQTRLVDLGGKTPLQRIKAGDIRTISEFLATFHVGAHI